MGQDNHRLSAPAENPEGGVRLPLAAQGIAALPRPAEQDPGGQAREADHHLRDPKTPLVHRGLAPWGGRDERQPPLPRAGSPGKLLVCGSCLPSSRSLESARTCKEHATRDGGCDIAPHHESRVVALSSRLPAVSALV